MHLVALLQRLRTRGGLSGSSVRAVNADDHNAGEGGGNEGGSPV